LAICIRKPDIFDLLLLGGSIVIAKKSVFFLLITWISISYAQAQMPQHTIATYDDWTISCTMALGREKSCELVQSQLVQGQTAPVSQITITRPTKSGPFAIFFQVPPNVWLKAGVNLSTADKDTTIAASFIWCTPTRCLAQADLSDVTIKKLNLVSDPGGLSWKDATQREVTVPVSFKGFSYAASAMNEGLNGTFVASKPEDNRFDGQWATEAECQAVPPNVAKTKWRTNSKIENGKLLAQFGDEGKPGSGKFEGVINADGHVELSVNGLTGDSKYNSNDAPEKTPYTWRATGSFSGTHGTATKTEGRFCTVSFSKSS
jgi:invasion protein IalB